MQLTLPKTRKYHFFADYFGKHFHCDRAKADEYGITRGSRSLFSSDLSLGTIKMHPQPSSAAIGYRRALHKALQFIMPLHFDRKNNLDSPS
jgi:hypothetical protein